MIDTETTPRRRGRPKGIPTTEATKQKLSENYSTGLGFSIAGRDAATPGEAKNSWLTGCAAWTFLTVSQGFCGIQPDYNGLRLDPCIPSAWPGFKVTRRFRGATYRIAVTNPSGKTNGIARLTVNGRAVEGNLIPQAAPGETVTVEAVLSGADTSR